MKITITTPFVGKEFCFEEYKKSIEGILKYKYEDDITFDYVIWDNANDDSFTKKLKEWADTLGIKIIYWRDLTPKFSIENTSDYAKISQKIADLYSAIFSQLVPEDTDFVLNIEDDVTFEEDHLHKLIKIMKEYPEVATAVGSCYGRRLGDRGYGVPCIWNFTVTGGIPKIPAKVTNSRVTEQPFGIQIVGSAHVGFWLTRYPILKELGWKYEEDGEGTRAGDICWGYRLWKYGKGYMVVDWSVRLKHWSNIGGVVDYFTWGHTNSEVYQQVNVVKLSVNNLGEPIIPRGSPQFIKGVQISK